MTSVILVVMVILTQRLHADVRNLFVFFCFVFVLRVILFHFVKRMMIRPAHFTCISLYDLSLSGSGSIYLVNLFSLHFYLAMLFSFHLIITDH